MKNKTSGLYNYFRIAGAGEARAEQIKHELIIIGWALELRWFRTAQCLIEQLSLTDHECVATAFWIIEYKDEPLTKYISYFEPPRRSI